MLFTLSRAPSGALAAAILAASALAAPSSTVTALSGLNLRILPLGDSITYGIGSSTGNSYRGDLEKVLAGNTVEFVGSIKSGKMAKNANEGHNGALISQISNFAKASLPKRPNVVLLHAGTNDMVWGPNPVDAPKRLSALIDQVLTACPDAVLLVAQIVPAGMKAADDRTVTYNNAIPGIVVQRASAGKHILVVDMHSVVSTKDLKDGVHPNDAGYKKMADVWFAGIEKANANGWISPPVKV